MADPVLSPGQYSIGVEGSSSALVYGAGAGGILIASTQVAPGEMATQDQPVTGHDGALFGADTLAGMTVTQTGQAFLPGQPAAALDAYAALASAWNDPAVRLTPGTVACLRVRYPGSTVTRRCYGRGRAITPVYGSAWTGYVPFTALFQAADGTWYDDAASTVTITALPSFSGGFTPPAAPPFELAATSTLQSNVITNTGSLPTWPVISFTGPCAYPGLSFPATPVSVGYNGVLKAGHTVVIDTRPWARTALLDGRNSVAGLLTGSPMIALQVQPGSTLAHLSGQDFTGTSLVTVTWRNATTAIGGTT